MGERGADHSASVTAHDVESMRLVAQQAVEAGALGPHQHHHEGFNCKLSRVQACSVLSCFLHDHQLKKNRPFLVDIVFAAAAVNSNQNVTTATITIWSPFIG